MLSCYGLTDRSDRNGVLDFEVATRRWLQRSGAKSFGADLGGNKSNHSRFTATRVELQMKSSLRLDSRYNTSFIHAQIVLRKRYISRYVS